LSQYFSMGMVGQVDLGVPLVAPGPVVARRRRALVVVLTVARVPKARRVEVREASQQMRVEVQILAKEVAIVRNQVAQSPHPVPPDRMGNLIRWSSNRSDMPSIGETGERLEK